MGIYEELKARGLIAQPPVFLFKPLLLLELLTITSSG